MNNKILLFGPGSGSNVFQNFSLSIEKQFAAIGVSAVTLDLQAPDFQARLIALLNDIPLAVVSFAGIGGMFQIDGKNIWELARVPFISIFGDSPAYFFDLHGMGSNWQYGLYGFPEHYDLRKSLPLDQGFAGIIATPFLLPPLNEKPVNVGNKLSGKLVFPKTGNSSAKLRKELEATLPEMVFTVWRSIADMADADLKPLSHGVICAMVEQQLRQMAVEGHFIVKLKLLLIALLDDYVRRLESEMVAEVLMDYPAIVCGNRWEHLNTANRRGTYIPVSDYGYTDTLMADALAVVHVSPNTAYGIHDRQLRAIAHGTACLSNSQTYLNEAFNLSDEITYDFDPDSLRNAIEWILANKEAVVESSMHRAELYQEKFHIGHFYDQIRQIAEFIRFVNADARPSSFPDYLGWPPTLI